MMKVLFVIGWPIRLVLACVVFVIVALMARDKYEAQDMFDAVLSGNM